MVTSTENWSWAASLGAYGSFLRIEEGSKVIGRMADALRRTFGGADHNLELEPTGALKGEVEFSVLLHEDELDGGYIAVCLNVPGAASQGETPSSPKLVPATMLSALNGTTRPNTAHGRSSSSGAGLRHARKTR